MMNPDRHHTTLLNRIATALIVFGVAFSTLYAYRTAFGDGYEYYAMAYSIAHFGRPFATPVSKPAILLFEELHQDVFRDVPKPWEDGPMLDLPEGHADYPHFWFYSLLLSPYLRLSEALGVSVGNGVTALHLSLFLICLWFAWKYFRAAGAIAVTVLTFYSPVANYTSLCHTEFFTVQFGLLAILFTMKQRYHHAALAFAIQSTQNPPFAVPALVALAFGSFWPHEKSVGLKRILTALPTIAIILLHPLYYLSYHGNWTPQLVTGATTTKIFPFSHVVIWLFDPDLGLLPNWPPAFFLVLGAGILWVVAQRMKRKSSEPSLGWHWKLWTILGSYLAICSVAPCFSASLNSGSIGTIARYSLWNLPLFLAPALYIVGHVESGPPPVRWIGGVLASILGLALMVWLPFSNSPTHWTNPSSVGKWLYSNFPGLYNPPYEIFVERYSGLGESREAHEAWAVSGPQGRKILVSESRMRAIGTKLTPPSGWRGGFSQEAFLWSFPNYSKVQADGARVYLNLNENDVARLSRYPVLRLGEAINGSAQFDEAFIEGWSRAEGPTRWTDGSPAILRFDLQETGTARDLVLRGRAYAPVTGFVQNVVFRLNGHVIGSRTFPHMDQEEMHFDAAKIFQKGVNELQIHVAKPTSPLKTGIGVDERELGFSLAELRLVQQR
jgi:hypothetical protein